MKQIQNKKLIDNFIQYLKNTDYSENTILTYLLILKRLNNWGIINNNSLSFLMYKKIDYINLFGYLRNNLKLSNKRIGLYKSTLSSFSNYIELMYEDIKPNYRNIVKNIHIGDTSTAKKEKLIINDAFLDYMLNRLISLKKYKLACYLSLLASSGMRKSEVLQMKVSYFNKDHLVFNNLFYETDKIRTKGKGKNGKILKRYILVNTFNKYLNLWLKERERLGIKSDYLFTTKYNKQFDINANTKTLDSYSNSISRIFNINFYSHSLRHYFTTKLIKMNFPESIIKDLMQWENIEMINVYSDLSSKDRITNFINNANFSILKL